MGETILVIKHGALGDFVLASGRMRTIRARHPQARITLVTERFLVGLAKGMGLFDEIVEDSRGYHFGEWWRVVVRTIARRRWTAIYDLQSSNRTRFRYYPLALFATCHALRWARLTRGILVWHESTRKLPFVPWVWRNRREPVVWDRPDLSMCHGARANFAELPAKYALLIPGCSAGNEHKRWPARNFRALTDHLASCGLRSVVIGTKAEEAEINAICEGNPHAVNFLGKNTIADIPDLANGAAVVVGNDTGPSHIAHIAGARTVMLFIDKYFQKCSPKNKENVLSLHAPQMADLPVREVIEAVGKMMRHA